MKNVINKKTWKEERDCEFVIINTEYKAIMTRNDYEKNMYYFSLYMYYICTTTNNNNVIIQIVSVEGS